MEAILKHVIFYMNPQAYQPIVLVIPAFLLMLFFATVISIGIGAVQVLPMDVLHLKDCDYTTLSGGERQRVHLARVLTQVWEAKPYPTRYILLDEPTSSLDLHHQHETLAYLQTFSKYGVGIVIVLHDLNLAAMYADNIFVLKQGYLIAQGSPKEVFNEELISYAFEYNAHIQSHPDIDCPMIIPVIAAGRSTFPQTKNESQLIYHSNEQEKYHV